MKKNVILLLMVIVAFATSCKKDDPPLPDNTLSFSATEIGFETAEAEKAITLNASRAVTAATQIIITVTENGATYGKQYTTEPAVANGKVTLSIAAGQTQATLKVKKVAAALFDGNETLAFAIESVTGEVVVDKTKTATLKFGSILSQGDKMTIEGKLKPEDKVVEPVYIDFSQNQQHRMAEMPYTLGFYCGDDFRVQLNYTADVRATFAGEKYESAKTDINAVTIEDAKKAINIGAVLMSATGMPVEGIDNPNGSFDGLVFRKVSATETENKVYFVTTGTSAPEQWYKVKVNQKDKGYVVQYALVGDKEIKTVNIEKKSAYNFIGLDLATGKTTEREPRKERWDILYSSGMNVTTATMGGGAAVARPYTMSDLIFINNLAGVKAAEVSTESIKYDAFSKEHLQNLKFSTDRNVIGSNWRSVFEGIYTNKYYVVKDPAGNTYKLRFLKMGVKADGGVRGRPEIEYKMIK